MAASPLGTEHLTSPEVADKGVINLSLYHRAYLHIGLKLMLGYRGLYKCLPGGGSGSLMPLVLHGRDYLTELSQQALSVKTTAKIINAGLVQAGANQRKKCGGYCGEPAPQLPQYRKSKASTFNHPWLKNISSSFRPGHPTIFLGPSISPRI